MNIIDYSQPARPLVANVFGTVVAAAVLLGWPLAASAADEVVLNTADAGAGSLRQAIADATAGDRITFAPGLGGATITLTSGQLLLNKSLSMDASALTGGISVSGNNASRVFEVAGGQTTAEFIGLTITGGQTTGNGGGILNSSGTLVLTDTTLSGNSAVRGGGVSSEGGALTVNRCRVTGNTAASDGGGLYCRGNSGAINIIDTTISGNAATTGGGGGLFDRFNVGVTISRSTLSANSAVFGAGVYSGDGVLEVANSTIADNTATTDPGGGMYLGNSTATLDHVTIVGNRAPASGGGGMVVANTGLTLKHSIIAGNSATPGPNIWYISGPITRVGANLIGNNDTVTVQFPAEPLVGTSASPLDPLLAPLGDYGGPTRTMPPLPGSPAIDAARSGPANDQRGTARPQGVNFDLGAVERIPDPVKLSITRLGNGSIQIGFTKPSSMTHSVLASTNLDLPFNLWSNLGPALETPPGSGQFQFVDSQATNYPRRFYVIEAYYSNMVTVAGGTLATANELNGTAVSTFQIGKYEVTWGEWQEVSAQAASRGYDIGGVGAGCADDHPVHSVFWHDILKWCNLKSEMEGLTPVYTVGESTFKTGYSDGNTMSQNLSANGYRLPLEAEWEFAARGGNQTHGFTYAGSNNLNAVGWYWDNSGGAACDLSQGRGTWPVGQKAANELGLYDMSGNVWEWCWDPFFSSGLRSIRGGSWDTFASDSTVSARNGGAESPTSNKGLRLARSSGN